ncbi:hypothetical protein F2Q70_00012283 [Brassica cretica]|uniref:Uncharacterized protein n=1 Tax=Brassica cretica TaxID=69181 RepID=A0A8S9LS56_BRACR|nr:hypothetical protein F2Q70_00012283 [Brassica cretica]
MISPARFDDSDDFSSEIQRLRRFLRRVLTKLTSDEIWQRLQAQTNRTRGSLTTNA